MTKASSNPPRHYEKFKQTYPLLSEAYEQLGAACHDAGPLDRKTRELVKLGLAIGAGLEGATHAHARLAREADASPEEIRHAVVLSTTSLGFSAMMRAMSWVDDVLK
jgi:alkylhydroperoxidase/carboxymuconolactone decarboxylase family protein YurZ